MKKNIAKIIENAKAKNLKELDLSSQGLTNVPKEIFSLENLEFLDLSFNKLKEIPPEMSKLPKLKNLNLEGNNLNTIPIEIWQAKNLTELYIENNPLKSSTFQYIFKTDNQSLFSTNHAMPNLKELDYEVNYQGNCIFIKDKQNYALISIYYELKYNDVDEYDEEEYPVYEYDEYYDYDDEENEYGIMVFDLYIFGKKETQKNILTNLRKKIDIWLSNLNKIRAKGFADKIEFSRFFYYNRKIKIDFDLLLKYKQQERNTYFIADEIEIPVEDLLKYIGAENEQIVNPVWQGEQYITSVEITDFKIFSNISCELSEQVNIFIGKNGLGKTSFLQALTLGLLPVSNVDKSNEFQKLISLNKNRSNIKINWGKEYRKTYIFKNEMSIERFIDFPQKLILAYGVNLNTNPKLSHADIIQQIIKGDDLPYSTKAIFKDYSTDFYDPLILLERLFLQKKGKENKKIDIIISLIKNTLDKYLDLFSEPEKINLHGDWAEFYFLDFNKNKLQTHNLSEGYKDFILQITDIIIRIIAARNTVFGKKINKISNELFKQVKGVIIIDEFDRHLHPDIQRTFLFMLKKDFPNIQFILTTHNVFSLQSAVGDSAHQIFLKDNKIHIESKRIEAKNILGTIREFYTKDFFDFKTQKHLSLFSEYLDKIYGGEINFVYTNDFRNIVQKLYDFGDEIQSIIASQLLQLNTMLKRLKKKEFAL